MAAAQARFERDDGPRRFLCSQPVIIPSVSVTRAQGVTMSVDGVRQDRDEGDKSVCAGALGTDVLAESILVGRHVLDERTVRSHAVLAPLRCALRRWTCQAFTSRCENPRGRISLLVPACRGNSDNHPALSEEELERQSSPHTMRTGHFTLCSRSLRKKLCSGSLLTNRPQAIG